MTSGPPSDCADVFTGLSRPPLVCELPAGHEGAHEAHYGERRWDVRWKSRADDNWIYRSEGIDPPFICDDDQCAPGACSLTEFPVWMRPYWCQHVSDAERIIRRRVFGKPGDPVA